MRTVRALVLVLMGVLTATAAPITFSATMTAGQEIPPPDLPNGEDPMGTASATFDPDMAQLTATLSWMGMTTPVVAAHIHRRPPASPTGPVLVPFFMGVSLPETDSYTSPVIDLTPAQVLGLTQGLLDGSLYFNIHTELNPPGEIRGDIAAIPEPSSWVLALGGVLVLWGRRSPPLAGFRSYTRR